ncbi:uncharacterized protein LOC143370963 [Andrena cerasifolii]|uniref:uncharacterized protein LOC143370963 n=1 Tax=Andrena cerasifolii TaxID=2819439 RepID=UPI00403773EB
MEGKYLYVIAFLLFIALLHESAEAKKVTIHVPYRVQKVKHTHTIYKIIPQYQDHRDKGDFEEDDNYDV